MFTNKRRRYRRIFIYLPVRPVLRHIKISKQCQNICAIYYWVQYANYLAVMISVYIAKATQESCFADYSTTASIAAAVIHFNSTQLHGERGVI